MRRRRVCASCRTPIVQSDTGRPRTYCSPACRQKAWKRRRRTGDRANRSAWWTPGWLRERLLAEHPIGLDAAACAQSRLVPAYYGPDHECPDRRDSLAAHVDWAADCADGQVVYLNGPYYPAATLSAFLAKAVATAQAGVTVVGLVPAKVTTRWWTVHVADTGAEVELLPGRLRYEGPYSSGGFAPFGAALVQWSARR